MGDVIWQDPTLWYQRVEVDKGSVDGVRVDDPALGDGALVGKVASVGPNDAFVALVTDNSVHVAAEVSDQRMNRGLTSPKPGDRGELLLENLPQLQQGKPAPGVGQLVMTAGFRSGALTSLYPPGIPIGVVSNASTNAPSNESQVQVSPVADLRHLQVVQILTRPQGPSVRVQLP
jgi:rod shape-determining protein MreC